MVAHASPYGLAAGAHSPAQLGHLRQQAEDLEGVFLNTLMKEMFASVSSESEAFGGGFAEETWRGMQAEQMAGALAQAGGIGLADSILADLLRVQEASRPAFNATSRHAGAKS